MTTCTACYVRPCNLLVQDGTVVKCGGEMRWRNAVAKCGGEFHSQHELFTSEFHYHYMYII